MNLITLMKNVIVNQVSEASSVSANWCIGCFLVLYLYILSFGSPVLRVKIIDKIYSTSRIRKELIRNKTISRFKRQQTVEVRASIEILYIRNALFTLQQKYAK